VYEDTFEGMEVIMPHPELSRLPRWRPRAAPLWRTDSRSWPRRP
jgi:hypothetical protein